MSRPLFRPRPLVLAIAAALLTATAHAQGTDKLNTQVSIGIASQSLSQALNDWSRQTGIEMIVPPALVAGKRTAAVAGSLTPREAMDRILAGTGLIAVNDAGAIVIRQAPSEGTTSTLPQVTVKGSTQADHNELQPTYAGGQVARGARLGLLGNVDMLDTPFNVAAYTSELIENQQARNIVDILANDASAQAGGPRSFDNFFIRGFAVNREEIGFDGLYGIANSEGSLLEGIERVEVLKGPSTLLNGSSPKGTAGGAINLVPKRATDEPLNRLTTSYMSKSHGGAHLDFGRRFGPDNSVGMRINASAHDGGVAADHETLRSRNLTAGLDYRSSKARVSLDLGTSEQHMGGARSNFYVTSPSLPAAPAGKANVWPGWTYQDKEHWFGVLRGEYDLTSDLTATLAYGQAGSHRRMIESFSVLADTGGTINAFANGLHERQKRESAETSLRWKVKTGDVKHHVVLSASHFGSDIKNFQPTINYGFTTNLYNPVNAASPGSNLLDQPLVQLSKTKMDSVALIDTLGLFNDRLLLTLGFRHQKIDADAFNYATGAFEAGYKRTKTTPAVAAVFRQTDTISLYANYVEALSQGATAPSTAVNANQVFPPFVSKQGEVGIKADWGKVATTLSAFQIERPSGLLDASNRYTVDGEQRNRGVELQVFGEAASWWRVLGGLTWTQAKLMKTQGGTNDGRQAAGAPEWQLKLGSELDIAAVPGLTATGRILHASSQPVTVDNSVRLPAWTRLDVGVRYATKWDGRRVVLRASAENVTNRHYWDSVASFQVLTYATPRTFMLSATVDF